MPLCYHRMTSDVMRKLSGRSFYALRFTGLRLCFKHEPEISTPACCGDIVIFMFFAFTGRETHAPGDVNLIVNALPTLLTFLIVWFAIALLGGVYRSDVITNPRSAIAHADRLDHRRADRHHHPRDYLQRTAIPWQFVAVTLGLVGRAVGVAWRHGVVSRRRARLANPDCA